MLHTKTPQLQELQQIRNWLLAKQILDVKVEQPPLKTKSKTTFFVQKSQLVVRNVTARRKQRLRHERRRHADVWGTQEDDGHKDGGGGISAARLRPRDVVERRKRDGDVDTDRKSNVSRLVILLSCQLVCWKASKMKHGDTGAIGCNLQIRL